MTTNEIYDGSGAPRAIAHYRCLVAAYYDALANLDRANRSACTADAGGVEFFVRASIDAYTAAAALAVQRDEGTVERQAWEAIANDLYALTNAFIVGAPMPAWPVHLGGN
jgi:hypothetical protein